MRDFILLSICLLGTSSRAGDHGPFANSGRIVTVVQSYGGAGPHWTVWAVQPERIVVYEQSGRSGISDKPLGETLLTSEQAQALRRAVAKISPASKGRVWFSPDVSDGVVLSIHFTADGSDRDDDIALVNVWRPEFRDLCSCISSALPPKMKITFEEIIGRRADQPRLPVVSQSTKEYRAASQPRREP